MNESIVHESAMLRNATQRNATQSHAFRFQQSLRGFRGPLVCGPFSIPLPLPLPLLLLLLLLFLFSFLLPIRPEKNEEEKSHPPTNSFERTAAVRVVILH